MWLSPVLRRMPTASSSIPLKKIRLARGERAKQLRLAEEHRAEQARIAIQIANETAMAQAAMGPSIVPNPNAVRPSSSIAERPAGQVGKVGDKDETVPPIRNPNLDLDYAQHMPKAYVDRAKRTVPRKIYGNRFGAPPVIRWELHPDDYVPHDSVRPWENEAMDENLLRAKKFQEAQMHAKFFRLRRKQAVEARQRMAEDPMTIFPGDWVQVMVGPDKNKQGRVSQVLRESGSVFVEGMHTKLERSYGEDSKTMGLDNPLMWKEQPLYLHKGQVMLLDPNDHCPCTASWTYKKGAMEFTRVSDRSGFEIPIPPQAMVTSEYMKADAYIDVPGKDTPSDVVLERTYIPKVKLFEDEIMEEMGIVETRKHQPTYWY